MSPALPLKTTKNRNKECLSLGCDEVPLFWGRSPVDMYRDFMEAFANSFQHMFGSVIAEITVGLGPAGELRYPSYPEGDARWVWVCGCVGDVGLLCQSVVAWLALGVLGMRACAMWVVLCGWGFAVLCCWKCMYNIRFPLHDNPPLSQLDSTLL